MKVLHVVASLALRHGGSTMSVRELCRGLARTGMEVEILTTLRGYNPKVDGPDDESLKETGVKIQYVPVHPWRWLGQGYAYSPVFRRVLEQAAAHSDIVHIHALWLHTTYAASRLCQKRQTPYVLSPCGLLDPYGFRSRGILKWPYGFLIERKTLRGAASIHFTSDLEQRRAFRFGVTQPTEVVPCAIQTQDIPNPSPGAFRARHPEAGNRKILLFLGRLHPKKRPDFVAKTFVQIARRRNDIHLVVAGPDGGAGSTVQQILRRSGLMDRATLPGLLSGPDKWAALYDSSLFLLPSLDENFGIAVLEAMAARLPVLISPEVGLADTVAGAGAGVVVQGNIEKWVSAAEGLLGNPERCRQMGRAGRHLAMSRFSGDHVASITKDLYGAIIKEAHQDCRAR